MLVLRDRLKNSSVNMSVIVGRPSNLIKVGATQPVSKPSADSSTRSESMMDVLQRTAQRRTEELVQQAGQTGTGVDQWTLKTWLQL